MVFYGLLWCFKALHCFVWSFMAKCRFDWTCVVFSRGHRSKLIWSCYLWMYVKNFAFCNIGNEDRIFIWMFFKWITYNSMPYLEDVDSFRKLLILCEIDIQYLFVIILTKFDWFLCRVGMKVWEAYRASGHNFIG